MLRREIHRYNWKHSMHRLWCWYVLGGRWLQCVSSMSHQFKFASFQFVAYRLHVQRRLQWSEREYMQCMRSWEIHWYVCNHGMHRLFRR